MQVRHLCVIIQAEAAHQFGCWNGDIMEMYQKIKNRRAELGLTLEEIGNYVGVGKSTVRKWESGQIANMRRDKIAKLAEVLEVSPAYLMGWKEEQPTTTKDDELLKVLQSNPTKLMLAEWICQLNEEQLQMVEGILQAVIGKSDK